MNFSDIRIKKHKYSRYLDKQLVWIKHKLLQAHHGPKGNCFHSYSYATDNKLAIAKSLQEGIFINKIWKIDTNRSLNGQTEENNEPSSIDSFNDNEDAKRSQKSPQDRKSLRRSSHPENELKHSLIDFSAGSLAGIAQIYASQPFDTVKVKQQTFPKLYGGMLKCFMHTYRKSGIRHGLYAGSLPAAVSSVAENSVLFTAYGACQKVVTFIMKIDRVEDLSALNNACAGFLAAFFSTFTMCPTELIKCKLQAVHEVKHYIDKQSTAVPITALKLTKDIFANEGIPGFYRGFSSTVAREMPGYFFFFGGYEAAREFFVQPNQTKDDIGPLRTMCAGAIGGMASWTSTFPIDVIKTRTQINNLKGSMLSIGYDILRKEGFLAFYNGLLPTVLRTIPATATLFLVYEYTKKALTEKFR